MTEMVPACGLTPLTHFRDRSAHIGRGEIRLYVAGLEAFRPLCRLLSKTNHWAHVRTARSYDVETEHTLRSRTQLGRRLQRRQGTRARLAWRSLPAGEADQLERELWVCATDDRGPFVATPGEGRLISLNGQLVHREREQAFGARSLSDLDAKVSPPTWRMHRTVAALACRLKRLGNPVRELGPYFAIALLLPGGTLVALTLLSLRYRRAVNTPLLRGLALATILGASIVLPGSS